MTDESLNPAELQSLVGAVVGYKAGEFVALMIHLGDRLGLYRKMAKAGPISADQLARWTELHERWVLEWLRGQAAARLVAYRGDDLFELTPEGEAVLVDDESPAFSVGMFPPPTPPEVLNRLVDAFHTGLGMTFNDHGFDLALMTERMTGAVHRMLPALFATLPDVEEKLRAGAAVLDVGCGAGVALSTLARAYPKSTFHGYDPSDLAIQRAEAAAEKEGLSNVTYHLAGGEGVPPGPRFDLVLTLDCMHDLPRPAEVVRAIRLSIRPDGCWIIKDIRTSDRLEENLENPLAPLFYGFSVLYCMSSSLSEPGGSGLGTMGFTPELAREMTRAGGFTQFRKLDFDADPMNFFYEVRP